MEEKTITRQRLPHWMKMKRAQGEKYSRIKNLVERQQLHTICTSGNCPNIGECWNRGTATFMILGDTCTRHCRFCAVRTGKPLAPDPDEPARVAESVSIMGLRHCVITSVDRDDLSDLGASTWRQTICQVKSINPDVSIEVLIPDFQGRKECIQEVISANPDVISHNVETVERLTPAIRSRARYHTSLNVLHVIADSGITAKSGLMLGLGEREEEVIQCLLDLLQVGVSVVTIGQYLQPTPNHMPVHEYIPPEQFATYRNHAQRLGFAAVESSPLVRSSYHAENHVLH